MATTLRGLVTKLNQLADGLEDGVSEARDDTAKFLVKTLAARTPVDTSRALSNWRVTTGGVLAHIPPHAAGVAGSTQAQSIASTIAAAATAIRAANPQAVLVIFNSTPYIRRLNEGSSRQAPAGFVEEAVLLARLYAKERGIRLER